MYVSDAYAVLYKVALRDVLRGVAQERIEKHAACVPWNSNLLFRTENRVFFFFLIRGDEIVLYAYNIILRRSEISVL